MKTIKLLLTGFLFTLLVPMASSAGIGDILCGFVPCSDTTPAPAVPEPSGALIMGAALLGVAILRRQRK